MSYVLAYCTFCLSYQYHLLWSFAVSFSDLLPSFTFSLCHLCLPFVFFCCISPLLCCVFCYFFLDSLFFVPSLAVLTYFTCLYYTVCPILVHLSKMASQPCLVTFIIINYIQASLYCMFNCLCSVDLKWYKQVLCPSIMLLMEVST